MFTSMIIEFIEKNIVYSIISITYGKNEENSFRQYVCKILQQLKAGNILMTNRTLVISKTKKKKCILILFINLQYAIVTACISSLKEQSLES